jgi:hypothetical protein
MISAAANGPDDDRIAATLDGDSVRRASDPTEDFAIIQISSTTGADRVVAVMTEEVASME